MIEEIETLEILYETQETIIGGDFNAIREEEDTHSRRITKYRTSARLNEIVERGYKDAGEETGNKKHTWHRRDIERQETSRLDYVLIKSDRRVEKYRLQGTILDHMMVIVTIGRQGERKANRKMYDYILGKEEYIIKSEEYLSRRLLGIECHFNREKRKRQERATGEEREEIDVERGEEKSIGQQIAQEGKTTLEIFSEIIISLQTLHDCIYTEEREKRNRDIKKLHENYVKIIREKKKAKTQEERRKIDEERKEIEREAVNRIEARDTAAQMRIEHLYRNEIGKLKPATFRCTREKTRSRKIRKLEFEGEEKTNEDEIAEIMDRWYQETANKEQEQTESLQAFLDRNRIRLPKITDEERDEMEREITKEEIEEALRDARTNTAPGPTGQTITYYRMLYQEIPDIFTEAINQLTFQTEQGSSEYLAWIRNRKVVYIPKKEDPKSPGDYRPLSMLETLYKVPARILAKRLIRILPGIIS